MMARTPMYLVLDQDVPLAHLTGGRILEGDPTPALIQAGSAGRPVEAWPTSYAESPGWVQWRLRDDRWDADHKPADVPYRRVMVGLNPDREDIWGDPTR